MPRYNEDGSRVSSVRSELEPLVAGVGVEPVRADGNEAWRLLERDGTVIVGGYPLEPASTVRAAAEVLGTRLRQLYRVRSQLEERGSSLPLHDEWSDRMVEIGRRTTFLRDSDADYLLLLCAQQSGTGGANFITDGYRLVDRLRDGHPQLWEFLTGTDAHLGGVWREEGISGVPKTPSVSRLVEYTRTGRRIVHGCWGVTPAPEDPDPEHSERMLDLYADLCATLAASAPRILLQAGEILFFDNYRCWHGRDAHEGRRLMHVLSARSVDSKCPE